MYLERKWVNRLGASAWSYFVPYQQDIYKALQELRWEVFRSGKYFKMKYSTLEDQPELLSSLSPEFIQAIREEAAYHASLPEPQTPDELLEYNSTEGTHTIIDMLNVSASPELGTVSPLNSQQLIQIFGIEKPTHAIIENMGTLAIDEQISVHRQRWEGAYIIIYKDEQPDEIFFIGSSGD